MIMTFITGACHHSITLGTVLMMSFLITWAWQGPCRPAAAVLEEEEEPQSPPPEMASPPGGDPQPHEDQDTIPTAGESPRTNGGAGFGNVIPSKCKHAVGPLCLCLAGEVPGVTELRVSIPSSSSGSHLPRQSSSEGLRGQEGGIWRPAFPSAPDLQGGSGSGVSKSLRAMVNHQHHSLQQIGSRVKHDVSQQVRREIGVRIWGGEGGAGRDVERIPGGEVMFTHAHQWDGGPRLNFGQDR
jgi:hypothetical protein